tara:strand:+ start:1270 stop:1605 length:336 start_codon:yes stop_codon:yes gene_type:complete
MQTRSKTKYVEQLNFKYKTKTNCHIHMTIQNMNIHIYTFNPELPLLELLPIIEQYETIQLFDKYAHNLELCEQKFIDYLVSELIKNYSEPIEKHSIRQALHHMVIYDINIL